MSILETSTKGHAVPSFSIYKNFQGEVVDSLKSCFIDRAEIERKNPPAMIAGRDGYIYTAVYDCRFPEKKEKIRVIISFQTHTYGRFAVIRLENREGK